MRIFVFGATGATGSLFVGKGLGNGHEVVAYVRSSRSLAPSEQLTVIQGDVLDVESVATSMRESDAVVSMVGLRSANRKRVQRTSRPDDCGRCRGIPGHFDQPSGVRSFRVLDLSTLEHLPGPPKVARADVARFLLEAATTGAWARRTAVLTT